ncbi:hypothetical protein K503DRAFT_522617 [Rhizopogon vinicolor AM-OR11-026]|uniref:Uncharacterized protein n=1 Tax=Rhizopogon vinicolor AM-OR11-026 TaxID=1314800 RepID=A0A1B7MLH6_9AGAM|nr:hypothetical protein K503DRAFT_522617 [Rhizopogon vinicolor AM-OR11-026]
MVEFIRLLSERLEVESPSLSLTSRVVSLVVYLRHPTTPSFLAVFVRSLVFFNISVSSLAYTVFLIDLASNCSRAPCLPGSRSLL